MFWLLFALMTAVAVGAALWPLLRRSAPVRGGDDVAVYRDQLDEIERDLSMGGIGPAEAEAARIEVSRRLIAAADAKGTEAARKTPALRSNRGMAGVVLVVLPLCAVGFYLVTGSPDLPGEPLAERIARLQQDEKTVADQQAAMADMVARVEAHLQANPDDGRGWGVIAPVYMRLERYPEAVTAYRNVIRLLGASADRVADLGEAMTGVARGTVTPEAKAQFERALALDPQHVSARFYLGLADKQAGRPDAAKARWEALLAGAPADAPWTGFVKNALASLAAPAGAPSAGQAAAGAGGPPELTDEQRTMVRGMIDGLAARLKQDGSDVQGWLRLVRSHVVMGDRAAALAAAADARAALAGNSEKLALLDQGLRETGLDPAAAAASVAPGPRVTAPAGPAIALPALPEQSAPAARVEASATPTAPVSASAESAAPGMPASAGGASGTAASAGGTSAGSEATLDDYDATMRVLTERLAKKLAADGSDVDGWEKLLRTYMALGQRDRASAALGDARKALAGDPDKLKRLDGVVKELGITG
ncbi:Cytochrome c heme lyase subunit CcmH [Rhodovulum sp. PH10]|uniref:c-type cytochrome biogenesis protein CcmI n=1 Tax=Rhodovulum sp. PH10 TaxID=1187851 RepID=UPI00027C26EF|nr:c-type cytochrome biogenesis protein CcmI [Rhodovulum sp. PH10]EJW10175.1 Cytochrome c heme lyase subunit CcmH [Rhodovulum sp. PH10]